MERREDEQLNQDYIDWQVSVRNARYPVEHAERSFPDHPAETPDDLFCRSDKAFILLAFKTFLDREPSTEELARCRQSLEAGSSKAVVAARVRYSTEARQRPQPFHLRRAFWLDQLGKVALLGRIVTFAASLFALPGIKRSIHTQQHLMEKLNDEIGRLHAELKQVRQLNRAMIGDTVTGEERQRLLREDLKKTSAAIDALRRQLHQESKYLRDRQLELTDSVDSLRHSRSADEDAGQEASIDENFYIAFEDYFRGSEATIRDRLSYYLPLLDEKLSDELKKEAVLDIGCGRGEWIALLAEHGYRAAGVDLNEKNVASCREKGLDANLADGIRRLRETPSRSLAVVSSLHVIEHLTLAQLHSLIIEALRCLLPGGLLLLETPNPENLITAANRFYTDPSHRKPIPPDLLEFLLKHKGFGRIEIHRLHPSGPDQLFPGDTAVESRLNDLLYGPQDYAVIARKP